MRANAMLCCLVALPTTHGSRLCALALRGGSGGSAPKSVDSGQPVLPEEEEELAPNNFAARVRAAAANAAAESVNPWQPAKDQEQAPVDFAAALEAARARMGSGGSKQSAMAAASHVLLGQMRPSRPTALPDTALHDGALARVGTVVSAGTRFAVALGGMRPGPLGARAWLRARRGAHGRAPPAAPAA